MCYIYMCVCVFLFAVPSKPDMYRIIKTHLNLDLKASINF